MVKIRWLHAQDWKTGHPFFGFNGYQFPAGETVEVMDAETVRMCRQHPEEFAIEQEANDVEAQGEEKAQGEEVKRQAQGENKSGYVPLKKAKAKKADERVDPGPAG